MTASDSLDDTGVPEISGRLKSESGDHFPGDRSQPNAPNLELWTSVADVLEEQTCVLDEDGTIIAVNRAWRRFAEENGADPDAVSSGVNYLSICRRGAADGDPVAGAMAAGIHDVLRNRRDEFGLEYPCHSPTRERWFHVTVRPFTKGESRCVVVMHKNVTVAARRIRLQSRALDGIANGVVIGDARRHDLPVVYANKGFEDITGHRESDVHGRGLGDLGKDLSPGRGVEHLLAEVLEKGSAREVVRSLRKDGTPFWSSFAAYPVRNDLGDVDHVVALIDDVTAEVEMREGLRASLEREQVTLAFAEVGTLDWDLDTGLVRHSRISEQLWALEGRSDAESVDALKRQIAAPDRSLFDEAVCSCLAGHGALDIEFRVDCEGGAQRWLHMKGDALSDRVGGSRTLVCLCQDVTQRRERDAYIQYIAHHDPLTGLPNRALFRDRLEQAITLARRSHRRVSVLFLDLDHFKNVNDTLGHATGDELLQLVAQRLCDCVRESDTVCRNGGDEFLVLLPDLGTGEEAARVATKIVTTLSEPHSVRGHSIVATPSVGIGIYPDDGESVDILLRNADAALYHAKATGRGRFQFFTDELNTRERLHAAVAEDLRHAIARRELRVHFQPRYDVSCRRVVGAEALVRWQHPRLGLLLPEAFLPVAEESDLILEIGDWVIREVCARHRFWRTGALAGVPIAVNVSRRQLRNGILADSLSRAIESFGIPPGMIELEFDDRLIDSDPDAALRTARRLREMGVRLSLDGVGAGHTDFRRLEHFPFDRIEIDMSLVRELPKSRSYCVIVQSLIALGHGLDLKVLAKGVERTDELSALRAAGCDHFQGRLCGGPLPPATFERTLARP